MYFLMDVCERRGKSIGCRGELWDVFLRFPSGGVAHYVKQSGF